VRALFDGIWLLDTTSARYVWEEPAHPQFWVPAAAFGAGVLTRGRAIDAGAFVGTARGRERETDRLLIFEKGPLAGLVRVEFEAMGRCCAGTPACVWFWANWECRCVV
jgi:hypothetical protein